MTELSSDTDTIFELSIFTATPHTCKDHVSTTKLQRQHTRTCHIAGNIDMEFNLTF